MNTVRWLVRGYFAVSALTLVAIGIMRHDTGLVTRTVWVRATIVTVSALLMTSFVARAARGSARALLRLRLVSAIVLAAIVVVVALPGFLPGWFRIEQAGCGLLLAGVVALVNGRRVRSSVAGRGGEAAQQLVDSTR